MNKELIKQYKAEFDHWLNGGEILYSSIDLEDNKRTKWTTLHFNDKWEFHNAHSYAFIINDEYAEFRKALVEGKTVQCRNLMEGYWSNLSKSNDFWQNFKGESKYYRVKPEEPKFKVGEILSYPNGSNGASIGKLITIEPHPKEGTTLAIFENGDTYDINYCEPFIDALPSFIKDKQCTL